MRRVWRSGSRVLSAILAAAMIFTSVPTTSLSAYAEEMTAQELTLNEETAVTDDVAGTEEETPAEEAAPAEGETPSEGDTSTEVETPSEGDTSTEGETPAEGDTETPAEGDTTPADEETPAEDETASEDEAASTDETTAEDELVIVDETAPDTAEEEISLASDGDATPESDFTWEEDGTTIKRYTGTDTEVVIPAKATSIGSNAFSNTNIESVSFAGNLVTSINYMAFAQCSSLETITLPNSVEYIGREAFYECTSLKEINLPDTIRSFDEDGGIFYGCTALERVHLSGSLKELPYHTFANCTSLREVDLPDSLEVLEDFTFNGCSSLQSIELPATIQKINRGAFMDCSSLATIRINGDGNISINADAFSGERPATPALVYCAIGSKAYNWFVKDGGFRVVTPSTIKYVLNGGTNAEGNPTSYTTGDDLTFADPTKEGYDFLGWYTDAKFTKPFTYDKDSTNGNLTLYAQWQKSLYEINYVLNGGTNSAKNPDSYNVGQTIKLQNPTRDGYTFGGWYTDEACTEKVTQITSALGDVTVYALWNENGYTITFNANKGTGTMDAITAAYDEEITLPPTAFTRTGYTFAGWNTKANGKGTAYEDEASEISNLAAKNNAKVVLYAQWTVDQIEIRYELNGGTNSAKNPAYVTIERNVTLSAPTRDGYKFAGWFTDAALETPLAKNTIAKTTTESVTVYAAWTPNTYTLRLDKNGGTYTIPAGIAGKYTYTDDVTLPNGDGASRVNYELTGWNTKKDRTGTHYDLGATVSGLAAKGTVTLYAEWTPVADKTYTIMYHNVDGWDNSKNPETVSFEKDARLVNPTKEGYTFKGWYAEDPTVNPKAKKVTSISKKTAENVEVYGVWTENSYTIAYNANKGSLPKGVKMNALTVKYSDSVNLTANAFTRKGYEFTGWNTNANGTGTSYADEQNVDCLTSKAGGKVTLYAQWQTIHYDITYEYVGIDEGASLVSIENPNPADYTIVSDVKLTNPSYYGYTFKGWYAEDPTVNAKAKKITKISKSTCENITVYGLWSENSYNLRFSTNTLLSDVKTITNRLYTDELTIPATVPQKDGYTFKGWALTRGGEALYQPEDSITFEELHAAGSTARGLIGTKYFTLYAVFEAQ